MTRTKKKRTVVAAPPASDPDRVRRESLARFLHDEVSRLVDVTEFRLKMLLELWSKHRKREPFLKTLRSRYYDLPGSDLIALRPATLKLLSEFYLHHEKLYLYMEYTEDMILMLEDKFMTTFREMRRLKDPLLRALEDEITAEPSGEP